MHSRTIKNFSDKLQFPKWHFNLKICLKINFLKDLCVSVCVQSCPTLCDPMDCSPPGSSVHGTLQARILEGVAMPSSRASS